jgi:hypothetical protein
VERGERAAAGRRLARRSVRDLAPRPARRARPARAASGGS